MDSRKLKLGNQRSDIKHIPSVIILLFIHDIIAVVVLPRACDGIIQWSSIKYIYGVLVIIHAGHGRDQK